MSGPVLPGVARAVEGTWRVNASGNWSVGSNWTSTPLIPNGIGDQANFISAATSTLTITQNVPGLTLGVMQFVNNNSYRIVGSNAITMDNSAPNAVLTVGTSQSTGAHEIATDLVLNDPLVVTQSSQGEFTFSGAISGGGGLIKSGGGTLILTGNTPNTFTGDVRVNAGTLILGKNGNAEATSGNLIIGDDVGGANADVVAIGNSALPDSCNVTINSSGWLRVFSPDLVQDLTMKSGSITVNGGGPSLLLAGQLQTIAHAEPATISGPGSVQLFGGTKILNVADGAAENDLIISARITTGGIDKRGNGTLLLSGDNLYVGPTIVRAGRLVVDVSMTRSSQWTLEDSAAVLLSAGGYKVIKSSTLTINGSARLDLTDNKLIKAGGDVGSWNGSAYTGITGLIQSGRNGGSWDGGGIVTSMPDALSGYTTLAVATANELGRVGGFFGDVLVNSGDVLVAYTYGGDANLDGVINIDDYGQIDFYAGLPGITGYFNGDFNYDGTINIDDYGIIDFNVGIQGPRIEMSSARGATAVPEAGGIALLGAVCVAAAPIGRRRTRLPRLP